MRNKTILLALAAVSAAMFALPAVASAGGWDIDPANGLFPLGLTSAGGEAKLTTAGSTVTCTENKGAGQYNTSTTGSIELTFHGCSTTVPFIGKVPCTTAGQPSGTITTTTLEFHNIYLEPNKTTPGILITPNAGHFATFVCFGVTTVVEGNGIVGDLTAPKCGETSKTATLDFDSTAAGVQKWMQITTAGTKFDLTSKTGGGAAATASEDAEGTITFTQNATMTCV